MPTLDQDAFQGLNASDLASLGHEMLHLTVGAHLHLPLHGFAQPVQNDAAVFRADVSDAGGDEVQPGQSGLIGKILKCGRDIPVNPVRRPVTNPCFVRLTQQGIEGTVFHELSQESADVR
jgi:hypothetical protein